SPARRWILGCGCGCLVLLLVIAAALYFGANWLYGAGKQLPSDHLLQPESVAVVHMSAPMADAETRAFLIDLLSALPTSGLEGVDAASGEDFDQLIEMLRNLDDADAGFGPSSMTMVFQPEGDQLASAFAVNLPRGSRFLRYLVRFTLAAQGTEHERDGNVVYELGEELITEGGLSASSPDGLDATESGAALFIAFQHDTPLFGSSKELLFELLERTAFEETPGLPTKSPLRTELDGLRSDWLITAAVLDDPLIDFAAVLSAGLEDPPTHHGWTELGFERARLGLGIQGQDVALRVEVRGVAEADVAALSAGLDELARAFATELDAEGLELAFETIAGEDSLLLQASLPNLRDWLKERIVAAESAK
ncbi:MAG: hypothetical protein P1V81_03845, partial [Planctomycetota bacterium]|nr:hypothetical protein [Planctomycetota bacterium]